MRALLVVLALCVVAHAAPPKWQTLAYPPAMPAPTTKGTVANSGAKIYWAEYGKPDGPPVVLLHGGMGNSDHWAFQLPALVDTYRVIAIDSRGQGRSTLAGTLSYALMATDVIAVLDARKIEKASFVGWSDGGSIALQLAVNQPARVDRMFIIGTNYSNAGSKPRKKMKPAYTFNRYAAKCKTDHLRFGNSASSWGTMMNALLPVWRNQASFSKEQIKSIQARSLIALGEHDEILVRAQIEEMGELIPNGDALILKGVSHFAIWQDPDAFNKELVAFLAAK